MEQMNVQSRFLLILAVTAAMVAAYLAQGIGLGQDLAGGTTLRFSLDIERAEKTARIEPGSGEAVMVETVKVIDQRINKFGLAETSITPLGADKFELSLPADSEGDVDSIIGVVTALGDLKFRIRVMPTGEYRIDDETGTPPRLRQPGGAPWVGAVAAGTPGGVEGSLRFEATPEGYRRYLEEEVRRFKEARDGATAYVPLDPRYTLVARTGSAAEEVADFVLLEEPSDAVYRFDGQILKNPVVGAGEAGQPVVLYDVKTDYQKVFGDWTEANVGLPMAIVLNEEFYSDPVIRSRLTDRVQITLGSGRSYKELEKEAEQIATVLQTGSLKVRPQLESRNKIGARLAGESRDRGVLAVILGFGLVLVFMIVYYRGSGVVANIALLLNLVLTLGMLAFFKAVLTLPGLAGIVLSLGMAVDANILINERIREERRAGRSMRRALSEGYTRAFGTILDANVTTLITAVFLYQFGSGPVRGFAVTLAFGLVISMFTAIYVTRTVFEWLMRAGRLTDIRVWGSDWTPRISWIALRRFFVPISTALVLFGLLVFTIEDRYSLYDVDFTGGLKLQAQFREPTTVDDVRRALASGSRAVTVETEDFDDQQQLVTVKRELQAGPYPSSDAVAVGTAGDSVEITVQRGLGALAGSGGELTLEVQEKAFEGYVRQALGARLVPDWLAELPREYTAPSDADAELKAVDGGVTLVVLMLDPGDVLTPERLATAIREAMPYWTPRGSERVRNPASAVERQLVIRPAEGSTDRLKAFRIWMKSTNPASSTVVERSPDAVRTTFAEFLGGRALKTSLEKQGADAAATQDVALSQPFPSADVIGSSVARRFQNDALIALVLSLLGIIVYVAFRFSSRAMGLAAVLCLFHDVAATLGIVAVANLFGLVDAKISLPLVAAFLTLVGFSVNDTVVVFDRIRENRGKKPDITPGMIDLSINQTLIRSIKTTATFLLAALALFVLNIGQRNVLEGFSFVLIVGAIIGSYSTTAIAAPLLLFLPWVWQRVRGLRPRAALITIPMSKVVLLPFLLVTAVLWVLWAIAFGVYAFVAGLLLFPVWALSAEVKVEARAEAEPAAVS